MNTSQVYPIEEDTLLLLKAALSECRPGERVIEFGCGSGHIAYHLSQIADVLATDINPETVEAAHDNAIAAGVAQYITFATCDFAATRLPPAPGVIFLNPEYGERLGNETDLEPLYSRIGDFFKQKCAGYTGCVLTGNMEMSRKIGLRSIKRIPFFNGPIECRMVVFNLYEGSEKE